VTSDRKRSSDNGTIVRERLVQIHGPVFAIIFVHIPFSELAAELALAIRYLLLASLLALEKGNSPRGHATGHFLERDLLHLEAMICSHINEYLGNGLFLVQ
jgi:hypothetical protein